MSKFLATYDPEKVVIVLGERAIVGFADGDMVTVSKAEDYFNNMVGTKGEVTRAKNANNTGTITFRLQHTSPSIAFIQALALAEATGGIPPVLPIRIYDPSSHDMLLATQCWLQTDPERAWGNETGVREYTFFAVNVVGPANANLAPQSLAGTFRAIGG
jgi:hypothetical protein